MLFILSESTNPYFNIASEEYLLKNSDEDIFLLYRNEPSIIVGKHQNTFAEISLKFVTEKNIKVVRRLSGGGTVFHDLGNLNFSFIQNGSEGTLVDFKKFTEPILQALIKLGVPATRSGRNDLLADGLKISGNAEHVYKKRTLHHGTLLFSSKLDDLKEGLKVNQEKFTDRSVRSVKSPVTNISNYLKKLDINNFISAISEAVLIQFPGICRFNFTDSEVKIIEELISQKYGTWDWNYGYSPKFTVKKSGFIGNRPIEFELVVEKGIINQVISNYTGEFTKLIIAITGQKYNYEILSTCLKNSDLNEETSQWTDLLFS
jgi:lipoate---protein ligase